MSGFEYCEQSTQTIIDTPLILVSAESLGNIVGSSRSKVEGNITISRPITNEYGTTHDPLSFTYSLIKSNYEPFTTEEQIVVERWLTSPKLSSELRITDCNNEIYSYFGLFLNTEWIIGNGGFAICTFTFQVNGRHAFRYYEFTGSALETIEGGPLASLADEFDIIINCETDELKEYIYPRIEYTPVDRGENASVVITNTSDLIDHNSIEVTTQRYSTIVIDSQHCILGEYLQGTSSNYKLNLIKYKDIGLADVGNIYWPRLLPGTNILHIEGHVDMKVSFYVPIKKVGGWLI